MMANDHGRGERAVGGGSGIRTHDTVSRIHAFQASAFSHSAIPPGAATPEYSEPHRADNASQHDTGPLSLKRRHRNLKHAGADSEAVMRSRVAVIVELLLGCRANHKGVAPAAGNTKK